MTACDQLKVNSQNDQQKLEKAKEMTYLKGFYEGVSAVWCLCRCASDECRCASDECWCASDECRCPSNECRCASDECRCASDECRCASDECLCACVQVLTVGEYAGEKVQEAKKKVQALMVSQGEAALYQEPESTVVSRSGDVCVVALCDQW